MSGRRNSEIFKLGKFFICRKGGKSLVVGKEPLDRRRADHARYHLPLND